MLSLKSRKKGVAAVAISLVVIGGSLFALNINKVLATTLENDTNTVAEKKLNQNNSDYTGRRAVVKLETYTYKNAPEELRKEHEENCKALNIEIKDSDVIGKFASVVWDK